MRGQIRIQGYCRIHIWPKSEQETGDRFTVGPDKLSKQDEESDRGQETWRHGPDSGEMEIGLYHTTK